MNAPCMSFTNGRQAVDAMVAAGAVFTVRRGPDGLGESFTFKVGSGGDLDRCRAILRDVKARPAPFLSAFKHEIVCRANAERDASSNVEVRR